MTHDCIIGGPYQPFVELIVFFLEFSWDRESFGVTTLILVFKGNNAVSSLLEVSLLYTVHCHLFAQIVVTAPATIFVCVILNVYRIDLVSW